jgi:nucleoid-associated protein YgaU
LAQSSAQLSAGDVVVRSGDSLWSLAAARLPGTARPAEVERAWRAVYAANRAEIGPDPGLIHPGQRLHLPEITGEGDDR